jgi:ankyrin repeat protein
MCIPINSLKLVPLQSKAEDSLFTLLNLHPDNAKDLLGKEKIAIWAKVEILMDLCPSAFCRKYKFKSFIFEVHPLGIVCALKAPEDLIKTVYEVFPEAANDAFFTACAFDVDLEVIKWLYNKAPEVVKWKDPSKLLPLHVVMERDKQCLRTVQFLYQSYPAALICKDEDGCTPLHSAFRCSSLAIVKFLIGKSKAGAVEMENNYKKAPLHYAFLYNKHEAVLEFVATKYPDFLKKPRSSDGQLPLHVACAISSLIVGIQVLLEHYPDSARQKDKQGKLPLALACKNETLEEEEVLELLELLVRVYPEAVDVEDNDGDKAIDLETYGRLVKHMAKQPRAKKRRIHYNIDGEELGCLFW